MNQLAATSKTKRRYLLAKKKLFRSFLLPFVRRFNLTLITIDWIQNDENVGIQTNEHDWIDFDAVTIKNLENDSKLASLYVLYSVLSALLYDAFFSYAVQERAMNEQFCSTSKHVCPSGIPLHLSLFSNNEKSNKEKTRREIGKLEMSKLKSTFETHVRRTFRKIMSHVFYSRHIRWSLIRGASCNEGDIRTTWGLDDTVTRKITTMFVVTQTTFFEEIIWVKSNTISIPRDVNESNNQNTNNPNEAFYYSNNSDDEDWDPQQSFLGEDGNNEYYRQIFLNRNNTPMQIVFDGKGKPIKNEDDKFMVQIGDNPEVFDFVFLSGLKSFPVGNTKNILERHFYENTLGSYDVVDLDSRGMFRLNENNKVDIFNEDDNRVGEVMMDFFDNRHPARVEYIDKNERSNNSSREGGYFVYSNINETLVIKDSSDTNPLESTNDEHIGTMYENTNVSRKPSEREAHHDDISYDEIFGSTSENNDDDVDENPSARSNTTETDENKLNAVGNDIIHSSDEDSSSFVFELPEDMDFGDVLLSGRVKDVYDDGDVTSSIDEAMYMEWDDVYDNSSH